MNKFFTLIFLGLLLVLLRFSTHTSRPATSLPSPAPASYANLPTRAVAARTSRLPGAGQRPAGAR